MQRTPGPEETPTAERKVGGAVTRVPRGVPAVEAMPGAVYSPWADRARERSGPLFPLHVGDTWRTPPVGCRMEDLRQDEIEGLNRYSHTRGVPEVVDALVDKVRDCNGLVCERESLIVTAGATAGLFATVGAMADAGDEVLILAPFWPLIRGMVQAWRARPVEVPFYDRIDGVDDATEAVRSRITDRTRALYVSTPSNPTGRVLPTAWLEALAELARSAGIWLLSDEVYEDIRYGPEHVSIGRFAPERTVSAFSFSKAYGMAGNRVGYLVAPPELAEQIHKITTHSVYNAPTASQWAGLHALRTGGAWLEESRRLYQRAGAETASRLGLPEPEGSTFLFVDVSRHLDDRGLDGFLADCFEDGVLVAPGASSGRDYAGWVRLCYTAAPPEIVAEAARLLAARLGMPSRSAKGGEA